MPAVIALAVAGSVVSLSWSGVANALCVILLRSLVGSGVWQNIDTGLTTAAVGAITDTPGNGNYVYALAVISPVTGAPAGSVISNQATATVSAAVL